MRLIPSNSSKKCVIYTSYDLSENSLKFQEEECMRLLAFRRLNFIKKYTDETDDNIELNNLLKETEKGEFDIVVVYRYLNLGRDPIISLKTINELRKKNIIVICCVGENEGLDLFNTEINSSIVRAILVFLPSIVKLIESN